MQRNHRTLFRTNFMSSKAAADMLTKSHRIIIGLTTITKERHLRVTKCLIVLVTGNSTKVVTMKRRYVRDHVM